MVTQDNTNFKWKDRVVKYLHLELSNYCNAACPFCPRYVDSSALVRPDLKLQSMTIDNFKKWFPPNFMKNIERIMCCGTHGDPMMCKDIIPIIEYIQNTAKNSVVLIYTNGGTRDETFWFNLGKLFAKDKSKYHVTFSIDGLEDTNHIYRRNVEWKKLISNLQAYRRADASAHWEFLIFGHNEHQIESVKELSKELGITDLRFKRAFGFENKKDQGLVARGVYDKEGNLEYIIHPPTDSTLVASSFRSMISRDIPKKKDFSYLRFDKPGYNHFSSKALEQFNPGEIYDHNNYVLNYENFDITCKSCVGTTSSEIYVSCNGIVFPCCFIGTRIDSSMQNYEDLQLRYALNEFGKDNFDLNKKSIFDIIYQGNLDSVYAETWDKHTVKNGKLAFCAMTCGKNSEVDKLFVKESNV